MNSPKTLIIAACLLALVGAGCGSNSIDSLEGDAQASVDAIEAALADIETEMEAHTGMLMDATDMEDARHMTDDYAADFEAHHEAIDHALQDLGGCMHGGEPPHTDELEGAVEPLEEELGRHWTAMADLTLDALPDEIEAHVVAMEGLLSDGKTEAEHLGEEALGFVCPRHDPHGPMGGHADDDTH